MNQYLLLLGPTLGFVLGVFFTWFLMYSRMRQVEKNADAEKKQLESRLEKSGENESQLAVARNRLEEAQSSIESLKKQVEEKILSLNQEIEKRLVLEEKNKKIEILEKLIEDLKKFEHEAIKFREKNQNLEDLVSERNESLKDLQQRLDLAEQNLKNALEKNDEVNERIKELAVFRERSRKLEDENCNLLKENEQLRNIESQLRQISEIKEMYSRTIEENQSFRNQDIARHFVQIKQGLQQSIKAYNRMLHLVNNPLLEDDSIIEIENDSPIQSEEEMLASLETDTTELDKIDGVKK
jgi:chromosome segregation ATPase